MHVMKTIACALPRVHLITCASVALLFTQPAFADRVGTIGDWETWTDADGKPNAVAHFTTKGQGASNLRIACGEKGKLKFEIEPPASGIPPQKIILDNPGQDEFATTQGYWSEIAGNDAEKLLTILIKEETTARSAGAKSWTLIFFIDDPKQRGYSVNMGGVKEVRDHLLKWCGAPAGALLQAAKANGPKPQGDSYLASQPFLGPDRIHTMQFFQTGTYQVMNIRAAREKSLEWQGSYTISSNTLVLDPGKKDAMTCGFQYTPRKDFILSNCHYAGMWVAMQNVR